MLHTHLSELKRIIGTSLTVAGCALVVAAPPPPPVFAPDILVTGQASPILDNATQPLKLDGTYYNLAQLGVNSWEHRFEIRNFGDADLIITAPLDITGPNAGDFIVTQHPATHVAPGQRTAFAVRFTPSFVGQAFATVNISNNDPDEGHYNFVVRGDGVAEALVGPDLQGDLVFYKKYKCKGIPLLACKMSGRVEVQNLNTNYDLDYATVRIYVVNGDILNGSTFMIDEKVVKKLRTKKKGKAPKVKKVKFKGYVPPGFTHIYAEVVPAGDVEDLDYTNNRTAQPYGI